MTLVIEETGLDFLPQYATIPISFCVQSVYRVEVLNGGLDGLALVEEPADTPYMKDYDRVGGGDTGPLSWAAEFGDVSGWRLLVAWQEGRLAGGATLTQNTGGTHQLEGSAEIAVLWDIRVQPELRGQGIGGALFETAAAWARARGCRRMKVETQNINVAACRFYARQGCTLGSIHRFGYTGVPDVAHEAMLLWYLELGK